LQENIIIYGGSSEAWENRPQLVESGWNMATSNLKDYKGDVSVLAYKGISWTFVRCCNGQAIDATQQ
jgi:hypothetical protein